MRLSLTELKDNQKAKIISIDLDSNLKQRLVSLGLENSKLISVYLRSPLNNPNIYLVNNFKIVIRSEIAKKIVVEVSDEYSINR